MRIELENIGRRFNREWIFRKVNYNFESGQSYAILGANGSGKSTLLQIIAGSLTSSEGSVSYSFGGQKLEVESVFQHLSLSAPYLELIEEFTLIELIDFHFRFKKILPGYTPKQVVELMGFEKSRNKPIKYYSSGMKQRTKLALAFCSDSPALLLDEPTSNLDHKGVDWYYQLIKELTGNRLLIICSNQEFEYSFCRHSLNLFDYK